MVDLHCDKRYKVSMKLFVIRDHPRCRRDHQTKAGALFGADSDRTWILGDKRGQYRIANVVTAATEGDEVGVTHLWLLAQTTSKVKGRDQMCNAVERLLAKGCSITETSTGRTCTGGAELAAMIRDASNVLAGNAKNPGAKRGPAKRLYTQDEAQAVADIWLRKDLINDAMRIAELKRRGGDLFSSVTVTAWYREIKPMLASNTKD